VPKEFFIAAWEIGFIDENIPEEKWAVKAMRSLHPDIFTLFKGTDLTKDDIKEMTWDAFKARFLAISAGPLVTTTYGNLMALDNMFYKPTKPFDLATSLRAVESIFNRLTIILPDPVKIHFVAKTLPPHLRSKVAFAADGRDHTDYTSFRTYLLAQNSATPRQPVANGNAPSKRLFQHNNAPTATTTALATTAPTAATTATTTATTITALATTP
jgi:hypothetical protein